MSRNLAIAVLLAASLGGCASLGRQAPEAFAKATLLQSNGTLAGQVLLTRIGKKARLTVALAGLTPGQHGLHLHTTGRCDAPDFATAGGHLNPGSRQHGTANPAGSHLGDLPNLLVASDGTGAASVDLAGTPADLLAAIFDADGTAIVVHAGADDYRTDPSGNSGARIACGVLVRG